MRGRAARLDAQEAELARLRAERTVAVATTPRTAEAKADLTLDPELAALLAGEYTVFPVPEGDCNGLYVTNKSAARRAPPEAAGAGRRRGRGAA